jgi:hypothetical protein
MSSYTDEVRVRMRDVREARGLTLTGVQKASDGEFLAVVLSSYERGDRKCTVTWLARYAQWLGIDVRDLLPPEPDHDAQVAAYVADRAERAVADVLAVLGRTGEAEARKLLADALLESA